MFLVKAVWSCLLKERAQLKAKLCRWSTRTSTTGGEPKLQFFEGDALQQKAVSK